LAPFSPSGTVFVNQVSNAGGLNANCAIIEYKHAGYLCKGFAVWDNAGAKRPGILVFPAIKELARLAVKAKSESARISAIRELLVCGLLPNSKPLTHPSPLRLRHLLRLAQWTRKLKYALEISNGRRGAGHGHALVRRANVRRSAAAGGAVCTAA
jgi:hypothetical protein